MFHLPSGPLLYLITDRRQFEQKLHATSGREVQIEAVARAAEAGCQFIQIREKDLSADKLSRFVKEIIAIARPAGAKILVNDRLDVALATGADGVHLRHTSLRPREVRRLVRDPQFLIGASTHSQTEAQCAEEEGADFIVCGPVYPTPSKEKYGPPLGEGAFAEICASVSCPVLAIGGINIENYHRALKLGARGIAAIGLFRDFSTLGSNIKMMLSSGSNPQD